MGLIKEDGSDKACSRLTGEEKKQAAYSRPLRTANPVKTELYIY